MKSNKKSKTSRLGNFVANKIGSRAMNLCLFAAYQKIFVFTAHDARTAICPFLFNKLA